MNTSQSRAQIPVGFLNWNLNRNTRKWWWAVFHWLVEMRWCHGIKIGFGLRIGWLFVPSPLDLLPLHAHAEVRSAPKKEFMVIGSGIRALCDATKAIQIELTLEGCQLCLTKIPMGSQIS